MIPGIVLYPSNRIELPEMLNIRKLSMYNFKILFDEEQNKKRTKGVSNVIKKNNTILNKNHQKNFH